MIVILTKADLERHRLTFNPYTAEISPTWEESLHDLMMDSDAVLNDIQKGITV